MLSHVFLSSAVLIASCICKPVIDFIRSDQRAGKTALCILSIMHIVRCMFYDPPTVRIRPTIFNEQSDFGFSMAYQETQRRLVVGAPTEDKQGKVYSCDMNNLTHTTEMTCEEKKIDLHKLNVKYARAKDNPEQKFYMGASIAATSDYFLACAPLLTMNLYKKDVGPDVYGTCIEYANNGTTYYYKDTMSTYRRKDYRSDKNAKLIKKKLSGGIGWTTLIDETNDLLLIAKTSLIPNFYYIPMTEPFHKTNMMLNEFDQYHNIGFAITPINFFEKDTTVYAFNYLWGPKLTCGVAFLTYQKHSLGILLRKDEKWVNIEEDKLGSMFGMALGAADLDHDGFEDLLVGAPAYSDEETVECGAIDIYIGGYLEPKRNGTIIGTTNVARFGSAIATQDMDGDGISEIVVSAPFEDGVGAVYVFSGYDIYKTLIQSDTYTIFTIDKFKLTQRLVRADAARFGFTLQFVSDFDENGCNELAVGAPATGTVQLYNCVQSVEVTMQLKQIGEATLGSDTLTMEVCAKVVYPKKPKVVVGKLNVTNNITGEGAYILEPDFTLDFSCESCTEERFCENVTIEFKTNEGTFYKFTTQSHMNTSSNKEFNASEVTVAPHSRLTRSIEISRHCQGDDCQPQLSMELQWSSSDPYVLGSSASETATIFVTNEGNSSYESCVRVRVRGAAAYVMQASVPCGMGREGHLCDLPKPLRRSKTHRMGIVLDLSKPKNTDADKILEIQADLYEKCNQREFELPKTRNLTVRYSLSTNHVYLGEGMSYSRQVSDKDIMDSDHMVYGIQEYMITNNGSVYWYNISAVISMEKKHFIVLYNETLSNCVRKDTNNEVLFNCTMDLMPNSTQKVMVIQKVDKSYIETNLKHDMLDISSQLSLYFRHTGETKRKSATSVLTFHRDITLFNNKWFVILIAVLAAALLLIIVITVLFKYGFFKRKQKERLEEFRESVRRRSSRRTVSAPNEGQDDMTYDGLLMDYDNDSAFEVDPNKVKADTDAVANSEENNIDKRCSTADNSAL